MTHRPLFSPFSLGPLTLANRIVMAPMTRSRALDGLPNEMMETYYRDRATAGLIISEAIAPSRDGLGYARTPGLFSEPQVEGFAGVTSVVHRAGGRIFAQLMHVGRIAHRLNMPKGARVFAPSPIMAGGHMWTDQEGPQPYSEPALMQRKDIDQAVSDFANAAKNALRAGFDGIELHGANGYLIHQFLHPHTNRRTDEYGGSLRARLRFLLELVEAVKGAVGRDKVGVRFSPYGTFNDLPEDPETKELYVAAARAIDQRVAYLHLICNPHPDFSETWAAMRSAFKGPLIINGGFTKKSAESTLLEQRADLVSFGRPFIANPDLVARFTRGLALNEADPSSFYTPGPVGYIDYPKIEGQLEASAR